MLARRDENAFLQSDFYRDKFHKLLRWWLISMFVIFALIIFAIYLFLSRPPSNYYANTTSGIILPMPPQIK